MHTRGNEAKVEGMTKEKSWILVVLMHWMRCLFVLAFVCLFFFCLFMSKTTRCSRMVWYRRGYAYMCARVCVGGVFYYAGVRLDGWVSIWVGLIVIVRG